jgi:hypothetical protein
VFDSPLTGEWSVWGAIGGFVVGAAVGVALVAAVVVTASVAITVAAATAVVAAVAVVGYTIGGMAGGAGVGGMSVDFGARKGALNPDRRYVTPPSGVSEAFPNAKRVPGKTPKQNGGGPRKRWINDDGCILEWDYQHGAVEKCSPNGKKHLGEFDPVTGEQTKPANPEKNGIEK